MRLAFALLLAALPQDTPPGPHVPLTASAAKEIRSWSPKDRIVATYYYYRYDVDSRVGLVNDDGSDALQDHPGLMKGFSGWNKDWHKRELLEMSKAGIDLVLPVFRKDEPGLSGLRKLAEAIQSLRDENKNPPRVGLFLDPEGLAGVDLRTDEGRERFYGAMRDYFSLIPPRDWAAIEGRPVVWLGKADGLKGFDEAAFETMRARFSKDFAGAAPFVVADVTWKGVPADRRYAWGAALAGPRELDVVAVGPGFNNIARAGRKASVRERENGLAYERSWYVALRLQPRIMAIETWNEFHEASEICESKEYGRAYLEATAKYVEKFKRGDGLPNPKGPWTGKAQVWYNLKYNPMENGVLPVRNDDGLFELVELTGIKMLTTKANKLGEWRYLYFSVDPSYCYYEQKSLEVTVEYLDKGKGSFLLQYDSNDRSLEAEKRWTKQAGEEFFVDSGDWKFAKFELPDAYCAGRQKGGASLRLAVKGRGLVIRKVLIKLK